MSTVCASWCRRKGVHHFNRWSRRWRTSNYTATLPIQFCRALKNYFPEEDFRAQKTLRGMTDKEIRACGFSFAKIKAIRDIAEKTLSGVIPSSREIAKLSDDEIIARLTQVRGVGQWTVEMLLIFQLGRFDVLPVHDFGVRTGFRHAYKKRDLPAPKVILAHGEIWRPHRTTASWFLWRAADAMKEKK